MSSRLPPMPLPPKLELPARDLLRGLRKAMSGPRRLFRPVGSLLPGSVRTYVDDLGTRLDRRQAISERFRKVSETGDDARGESASVFMAKGDATVSFARLCYHGLSVSLRRMGRGDLLISETVAGYAFQSVPTHRGAKPSERAAAVAHALLNHHAVGHAPGTAIAIDERDVEDSRFAIFVTMLWLLLERAEAQGNEAHLLALCFDVAVVEKARIVEAGDDRAKIATLLDALSAMI